VSRRRDAAVGAALALALVLAVALAGPGGAQGGRRYAGKPLTEALAYLQEQGLLTKFYRDFAANQKDDPTGYKTLTKTLDEPDMVAFQKKWETYVAGLRFP